VYRVREVKQRCDLDPGRDKEPHMTTEAAKQASVNIEVNNKPVSLTDHHTSGEAIKQAAITQGVAIKATFNLFRITGNKQHPVSDGDKITVHEGERFSAVDGDDNSWR
jgi:hypothetical protein